MLPALESVWSEVPLVVIDLETTGVDPATAVPCEVACARFERGELVGTWSSLLNPGSEMSEEVVAVHGITNAMVAGAPPAATAIALLLGCGLLKRAWPVGYNGQGYDRTILRRLAGAGADLNAHLAAPWIDPLVYVRDIDRWVAGSGRHRLGITCARHGIEHLDAHRALGDCIATGKLLWSLRERLGDVTLGELARRTAARGAAQTAALDRYWGRGKVHP